MVGSRRDGELDVGDVNHQEREEREDIAKGSDDCRRIADNSWLAERCTLDCFHPIESDENAPRWVRDAEVSGTTLSPGDKRPGFPRCDSHSCVIWAEGPVPAPVEGEESCD